MTPAIQNLIRNEIHSINGSNYIITQQLLDEFHSFENLKTSLSQFFIERLQDNEFVQTLLEEFEAENYIKARIVNIANTHLIRKSDLQKFYDIEVLKSIKTDIQRTRYTQHTLVFFENNVPNPSKFNYLRTGIKKFLDKQFDFIFTSGFLHNSTNINKGIMTANAGDSAQFLFLSRAILAGFNCSNVDVRSSRYDAVIDYDNFILRIQVKGISSGNSISFKDRDRGGQGIDHRHERNRGRRITSTDCDIYVAVDRQVGTCYLIPMNIVEGLDNSVAISLLEEYKENWSVIGLTVSNLRD
ncbi:MULTISPECIES: group I intron-associated PD-(D/E)XK endonuclease [Empedobacter]|uniref:group I intron-associated PD-(D/E)XK endonuclease n=1 Tax=Empedobacter TaxID=59734 RepID=UPI0015E01617|nr:MULTISPECIES: group I intron-associated PD-(D/E)XK endonuclease [Empedobacter]MDH2208410.1 group I intron-associated PD-(D/E)XK endonuclease [Empedobacter sp. GD03644]